MLGSKDLDELIWKQWRDLGFHYDFDPEAARWTFTGSRDGLARFSSLLREYVADPRNERQGEHEHYGPYFYLKVMTWTEPGINSNAIVGTLSDLARLADLVDAKLSEAHPGSRFEIGKEYAIDAEAVLAFDVQEASFEPTSLDPQAGRAV